MLWHGMKKPDLIYHKARGNGEVVHFLKFISKQKRHPYIEFLLDTYDKGQMSTAGNQTTVFVSIGRDEGMTKAKSFERGEWGDDEYVRELFDLEAPRVDGKDQMHEGVKIWLPPKEKAGAARASATAVDDIVEQEDPEAFGGDVGFASNYEAVLYKHRTQSVENHVLSLENAQLREEVRDMRVTIETSTAAASDYEALKSVNSALSLDIAQLRGQVIDITVVSAKLAAKEAELARVEKQRTDLMADGDTRVEQRIKEACGGNADLLALKTKLNTTTNKLKVSNQNLDQKLSERSALQTQLSELVPMQLEVAGMKRKCAEVEEEKRFFKERHESMMQEVARMKRVVAGTERLDRDEDRQALFDLVQQVRAESEANATGLIAVKERDAKIEKLKQEMEKLDMRLENANAATGEVEGRNGKILEVIADFGDITIRQKIQELVNGVFYRARDMWVGNFLEGDDGGEHDDEEGAQMKKKRKKQRKEKTSSRF